MKSVVEALSLYIFKFQGMCWLQFWEEKTKTRCRSGLRWSKRWEKPMTLTPWRLDTPQAICGSIPLPFTKFEFYYFLSLSFLIISKLGSLISNFFALCPLIYLFIFFLLYTNKKFPPCGCPVRGAQAQGLVWLILRPILLITLPIKRDGDGEEE